MANRPYIEPRMRQRMSAANDPMGETPASPPAEQAPEQPQSNSDSPNTFFVDKDKLGGKQWKEGEEIVFKIKSIDPQTGGAELYYAPEKGSEDSGDEAPDTMSAMDKTFGPSDEGTGGGY